jgi:hypothetical protein
MMLNAMMDFQFYLILQITLSFHVFLINFAALIVILPFYNLIKENLIIYNILFLIEEIPSIKTIKITVSA